MAYDGLTASDCRARWGTPYCVVLRAVTSTLDVVHEAAADGAPTGSLVLAEEQVRGRGRRGGVWHSPPGTGIWMAYLLRPATPMESGVVALRVGLAIAEALHALGIDAGLKWPNDVLVDGRKVSGVLCEGRWTGSRLAWIGVGIGINVRGPLPEAIAREAVALDARRPGVGRLAVLDELMPRLRRLAETPRLSEDEIAAYRSRAWLDRRRIASPVAGEVCGIDGDGALLVRTGSGVERVTGGHVVAA